MVTGYERDHYANIESIAKSLKNIEKILAKILADPKQYSGMENPMPDKEYKKLEVEQKAKPIDVKQEIGKVTVELQPQKVVYTGLTTETDGNNWFRWQDLKLDKKTWHGTKALPLPYWNYADGVYAPQFGSSDLEVAKKHADKNHEFVCCWKTKKNESNELQAGTRFEVIYNPFKIALLRYSNKQWTGNVRVNTTDSTYNHAEQLGTESHYEMKDRSRQFVYYAPSVAVELYAKKNLPYFGYDYNLEKLMSQPRHNTLRHGKPNEAGMICFDNAGFEGEIKKYNDGIHYFARYATGGAWGTNPSMSCETCGHHHPDSELEEYSCKKCGREMTLSPCRWCQQLDHREGTSWDQHEKDYPKVTGTLLNPLDKKHAHDLCAYIGGTARLRVEHSGYKEVPHASV